VAASASARPRTSAPSAWPAAPLRCFLDCAATASNPGEGTAGREPLGRIDGSAGNCCRAGHFKPALPFDRRLGTLGPRIAIQA